MLSSSLQVTAPLKKQENEFPSSIIPGNTKEENKRNLATLKQQHPSLNNLGTNKLSKVFSFFSGNFVGPEKERCDGL